MKSHRLISFCLPAALAVVCVGLLHSARGANTSAVPETAAKTNSAAAVNTNSAPEELPIPLSVFDVTAKPTKDPFFPLSLRQPVPQATNSSPVFSAACFSLKGVSGSASQRLAIVNNRTIAAGEDAEITTPSGKIKIHCVEVKEMSVVLRLPGQTELVEVSLRKFLQ